MIDLQQGRYYRLTYSDSSRLVFNVVKASEAKHLIRVRTNEEELFLIELLARKPWVEMIEVSSKAFIVASPSVSGRLLS